MKLKIKPLTKDQLIISIDRLTRFKNPETKYLRVFKDIIISNLLEPKYKKSELDNTPYQNLKELAEEIINSSIAQQNNDLNINKKLFEYECSVFNIGENVQTLLKNKINYKAIIKLLPDELPENLKYLKYLDNECNPKGLYPIKKIILCEGITEEILLPAFAKVCGFDFNKHGIQIISAGGKNQVVKYFYDYAECLKIPIFVLLDSDAKENLNQIKPRLRNSDKIHLIKSGEFEDLLPEPLLLKTLNYETKNISIPPLKNFTATGSTVEFLEEFFRHRGLHEFKKADFAHSVKANITDIFDVSDEIKEIFNELLDIKIM